MHTLLPLNVRSRAVVQHNDLLGLLQGQPCAYAGKHEDLTLLAAARRTAPSGDGIPK